MLGFHAHGIHDTPSAFAIVVIASVYDIASPLYVPAYS